MHPYQSASEFVAAGRAAPAGVLLVPLIAKPKPALQTLARVDALAGGAVSELLELGALGDEAGQIAHSSRAGRVKRIVLISLGDSEKLTAERVRTAGGAAARWLASEKVKAATLWIDGLVGARVEAPVAAWVGGMVTGGFKFGDMRKSDGAAPARVRVEVRSAEVENVSSRLGKIADAVCLAECVNYARWLAHHPPNVMHPTALAAAGRRLAAQGKLKCMIIDSHQARKLGMNGLLAVGAGAKEPPCLIRFDYRGAPGSRVNTVLIGKAVTFDTGGYSIKTAAGMESMKFDKCGGMAVYGAMRAVAALRLRCNVTGLVAAAENAISADAYRPADILRMASGTTVEVINTDAEGRLVLADALWYAQEHCAPSAMIDLATLTGGVVTALGKACAGMMSNNDALADELQECGRKTHERLWPLPLWDEYRELIKGTDSDIRNSSTKRHAHPIVGGIFLKEFVDDAVPWAHLDIAGVATSDDERFASGFGVRLLVEYLRRRAG